MVKPPDLLSEAVGASLQPSAVSPRTGQFRISSLLGLTPWLVPIGIDGLATATTDGFYLHLVIMWGIYSILTLGLNVVIGFAGLLALGQAAFYGFGAYASAITVMQYDVPYLGALLIAAVVPLLASGHSVHAHAFARDLPRDGDIRIRRDRLSDLPQLGEHDGRIAGHASDPGASDIRLRVH